MFLHKHPCSDCVQYVFISNRIFSKIYNIYNWVDRSEIVHVQCSYEIHIEDRSPNLSVYLCIYSQTVIAIILQSPWSDINKHGKGSKNNVLSSYTKLSEFQKG